MSGAHFTRTVLWLLLALGFSGALKLSYFTFTGGTPCPDAGGLYICYVVLVSYLAMILSQMGIRHWKRSFFFTGWAVTFVIAATGTVLELINGGTCPKSTDGLPMCYVSLVLCIGIISLFIFHSIRFEKRVGS